MDRNNKLLILLIITILFIGCFRDNNEENNYIYVNWIPKNIDVKGKYILDRNFHINLPKDSIYLNFYENNTFKAKNFFYSEIGWDSVNVIPYAEGTWSIEKNKEAQKNTNFTNRINLIFNKEFDQYNGIDKFKNKNNIFLNISEIQMNTKDSSFLLTIFNGDPDHNKNLYYFHQKKK